MRTAVARTIQSSTAGLPCAHGPAVIALALRAGLALSEKGSFHSHQVEPALDQVECAAIRSTASSRKGPAHFGDPELDEERAAVLSKCATATG